MPDASRREESLALEPFPADTGSIAPVDLSADDVAGPDSNEREALALPGWPVGTPSPGVLANPGAGSDRFDRRDGAEDFGVPAVFTARERSRRPIAKMMQTHHLPLLEKGAPHGA